MDGDPPWGPRLQGQAGQYRAPREGLAVPAGQRGCGRAIAVSAGLLVSSSFACPPTGPFEGAKDLLPVALETCGRKGPLRVGCAVGRTEPPVPSPAPSHQPFFVGRGVLRPLGVRCGERMTVHVGEPRLRAKCLLSEVQGRLCGQGPACPVPVGPAAEGDGASAQVPGPEAQGSVLRRTWACADLDRATLGRPPVWRGCTPHRQLSCHLGSSGRTGRVTLRLF